MTLRLKAETDALRSCQHYVLYILVFTDCCVFYTRSHCRFSGGRRPTSSMNDIPSTSGGEQWDDSKWTDGGEGMDDWRGCHGRRSSFLFAPSLMELLTSKAWETYINLIRMVFLSHDCLAKLDLLGAFKAKSFCFRISEFVNFTFLLLFTFANVTARHCKTTVLNQSAIILLFLDAFVRFCLWRKYSIKAERERLFFMTQRLTCWKATENG